MSAPLESVRDASLRRRLRKQKVAEPRPVCHYCGQRVPVNALVSFGGRLVKPTYREVWLFGMRTFRPHDMDGRPCKGSGQELAKARGWDR